MLPVDPTVIARRRAFSDISYDTIRQLGYSLRQDSSSNAMLSLKSDCCTSKVTVHDWITSKLAVSTLVAFAFATCSTAARNSPTVTPVFPRFTAISTSTVNWSGANGGGGEGKGGEGEGGGGEGEGGSLGGGGGGWGGDVGGGGEGLGRSGEGEGDKGEGGDEGEGGSGEGDCGDGECGEGGGGVEGPGDGGDGGEGQFEHVTGQCSSTLPSSKLYRHASVSVND